MTAKKSKKSAENLKNFELIIAEKPSAAKKIAEALSTSKIIIHRNKGVTDYLIDHNGKDIIVANAVGHLYGLKQKDTKSRKYPVFDIEWVQSSKVNKSSSYTTKYLQRLKKLAKGANEFTVATDYDVEGEVIGLNVVRFACKQKDANRMKFSTTTKSDLLNAYNHKLNHLDWGQAYAGETRHKLDWFYGINISRALTQAISEQGRFKVMSTGRVQGPLLKILVDKEKEIKKFIPVPYWELSIELSKDSKTFIALHKEDKFFDKAKFIKIKSKLKGINEAKVDKLKTRSFTQKAPTPFDLTALQIESFRCFKISPKETLSIAQELYTDSYISYPRTSSNQLPKEIGYKKILGKLSDHSEYKDIINTLLSSTKVLKPNNGKKKDPAHPAIYPTGEFAKNLNDRQKKVYDLIVKRFVATFGEAARRETVKVEFDANHEIFVLKGTTTKEKGWHVFYAPYVNFKEQELPKFKEGELVPVNKLIDEEKETKPPKRYTEASIVKELEKRNLGTKATRASILDRLFTRGYITGKPITVTEVGLKTENILEKFCPEILDEELTKNFEDEMEEIRNNNKKEEDVLDEAKNIILKTLKNFNKKKENVGNDLIDAADAQQKAENYFGPCIKCEKGSLTLKRGKYGKFLACDQYPECKQTLPLPKTGLVKYSGEQCEHCNGPLVNVIRKGKKPQKVCVNPDCPSRDEEHEKLEEHVGEKCPSCGKGKLVLRKSAYGSFLACDQFPKCKYIKKD
jgi:DNA topoisomerase-1